ncbi:Acetyltransferase (GNAT) domain protein [uncultured archaeon]|nr:Acetyltransferase (GNAT) domain protein [uncultured archaeon]
MKITKVKREDLKEISELRKETILKITSECLPESDLKVLIAMNSYKNLLWRYKYADMYCLKNKKKIIGTIDLYNNEIKGFYIHHEHIKEGLGTVLLDFIEKFAKKQGHKKIRLDCNKSAYGFYLKKGFNLIGKKEPTGKLIKRVIFIMEKELL